MFVNPTAILTTLNTCLMFCGSKIKRLVATGDYKRSGEKVAQIQTTGAENVSTET